MKQKTYQPKLTIKQTQYAIETIKNEFQRIIKQNLNLVRVSSPLFLDKQSKLNDNLSGVEKPVEFIPKHLDKKIEIIHSLAKWKRVALKKYDFNIHTGLYTDMNAIRAEEVVDKFHSLYVDQWDWEYIITEQDYNLEFLKKIVEIFFNSLYELEDSLLIIYPTLNKKLTETLYFIDSQKLYEMYPNLSANERELEIVKKYKNVFIIGIGKPINANNDIHDIRAPDYDNWELNGDFIVYHEPTDSALELMSMGIRVNKESLIKQAKLDLKKLSTLPMYYQDIINNQLPLTIGGGLGQSRLCMFLLEKEHIGEVQVSVWTDKELSKNKYIL